MHKTTKDVVTLDGSNNIYLKYFFHTLIFYIFLGDLGMMQQTLTCINYPIKQGINDFELPCCGEHWFRTSYVQTTYIVVIGIELFHIKNQENMFI